MQKVTGGRGGRRRVKDRKQTENEEENSTEREEGLEGGGRCVEDRKPREEEKMDGC